MKRKFNFWVSFAIQIVAIMVATFSVSSFILFCYLQKSMKEGEGPFGWMPAVSFVLTAVAVSVFLLVFISKRFFEPIEQLVDALKMVAAGNFSIHLPETGADSEIRRMNENFNKMVRELNSMEMLQSDFIQNVSHEFKTPLASIEGYASLLNEMAESGAMKNYSRRILESTRQLSALTGNILRLSRLENQQIVSEKGEFFLDEQIRQAYLSLEPLWREKDIGITMELQETVYYGNENLMFQIWTNLLSNAIKFTPDGGTISVEIAETENQIHVKVTDTGIGMTEDVKNRIFDRFYQAEQNRNTKGNGLGLALVKKIVELCEGTICVNSEPDQGSVFSVILPGKTI